MHGDQGLLSCLALPPTVGPCECPMGRLAASLALRGASANISSPDWPGFRAGASKSSAGSMVVGGLAESRRGSRSKLDIELNIFNGFEMVLNGFLIGFGLIVNTL